MAKCTQCGVEYESKRSTSRFCGPKCKQAFYRNRMSKPGVTVVPPEDVSVTPNDVTVTLTNLEKCRYCGVDLPKLQAPRKYPGSCYPCALKQPTKPGRTEYEPHFTGIMTHYERENYRPANELHAHEFNPVSRPGDSHYVDRVEVKE